MDGNGHLFYPMALAFIVAVSYLFIQREDCNTFVDRQLGYLGRHTLDIYIYHYFFIHITNLRVVGDWFAASGNIFIEVLLGIVLSIVIAYAAMGIGALLRKSQFINELVYGGFIKHLIKEK